jgi:hypothetical protein
MADCTLNNSIPVVLWLDFQDIFNNNKLYMLSGLSCYDDTWVKLQGREYEPHKHFSD